MSSPDSFLIDQIMNNDPPPPAAPAAPEPAIRRKPKRKAKAVNFDYDSFVLSAAEWGEVLFWGAAWALDAWFTATFLLLAFRLPLPYGLAIHVVVSVTQQHLWRLGWREHALPVIVLAILNIGTSLIGWWTLMAGWFTARPFDIFGRAIQVPGAMFLFYGGIALAVLIAVLPERRISRHLSTILSR
jgi:hypothetical protein